MRKEKNCGAEKTVSLATAIAVEFAKGKNCKELERARIFISQIDHTLKAMICELNLNDDNDC